ncbi:glycosyltransferase [Pontivivens ytuae]|uniref:Glycosyltransferase n=1 Tax=Pontivivens ytuae TaxID=2789856 RepID=A0A7S9LNY4_9RHOB|nr:glycosyltransferase [Pontivivens ytuae]QPH52621.1 glycosyltransferase [Pontivivens ytuae]
MATEDWFFASHFKGFAAAARAAGFAPVLAAQLGTRGDVGLAEVLPQIAVNTPRSAVSIEGLRAAVSGYRSAIRKVQPEIVHCIALKPALNGGIAARLEGSPRLVIAPTGLGALWVAEGWRARAARAGVRMALRGLCLRSHMRFLFENHDDPVSLGVPDHHVRRAAFVSGAGVAASSFPRHPLPQNGAVMRVAVVARMVHSKGILESIEAVRQVRAEGHPVTLDLWGAPDAENPASLENAELEALGSEPGVRWRGPTSNVSNIWKETDVAMLLSRGGEGLPRSLVEAAASGRPIVTTDVPGCRDVVRDGIEGYLVPPRDPAAAARALASLSQDAGIRYQMADAAYRRFARDMTDKAVQTTVEQLYRDLITD